MTTIYCDQKQCEHHQPEEHNKGICMAFNIELAEAPGGFWLSCRMKTNGKRMKPDKAKHVCGLQGFSIGPDGWKDICQACEEDKKKLGF